MTLFFANYSFMVILIEKFIREMNLDIYRLIEFIFPHKYEFLYWLLIRRNFGVFLLLFFELVPK